MKRLSVILMGVFTGLVFLASAALAQSPCPSLSGVRVGLVCVDKYEASVWEIPMGNTVLINKVRNGSVTLTNLTTAGAVQRGVAVDDYPCNDNGNNCTTIYAVSIPGVKPSRFITWLQAQQAAGNSRKRLLTNAEWQMAAAGTPDPG